MALQGQTVDVLFQPLNQQATATGGPIGRIKSLGNAVVKKITRDGQPGIRVEKRDGFAALPTAVRDPSTGGVSAKTFVNPSLFATWGDRLMGVWAAQPFVLSEAAQAWESPTVITPTQVLRQRTIGGRNDVVFTCDQARVGSRIAFCWLGTGNVIWVTIIDDDGTVVLSPTIAASSINPMPAKLASDGSRFWLIIANIGATALYVSSFDANGVGLTTFNTAVGIGAAAYFDVAVDTSQLANGVFVAWKNPVAGTNLTRYQWNGAAVTNSTAAMAFALCASGRVGFLRNDRADGKLYLGTIDGAGPFDHYVWQINTPAGTPANGHQYNVSLGSVNAAFQFTGYVAPTGNADITVALSFLDTTPHTQLNFTDLRTVTFAGVTSLARTQRSLTMVSRPFAMQGNYYAVAYYRSDPASFSAISQSTFFLIALSAPWTVCGRWEWGTAYADWADTGTMTYYMDLSSPTVAGDGGVHVTLPYRASSGVALSFVGDVFTPVKHTVDVVGVKDFSFGPDFGRALDLDGSILMPGPQAVSYSGTEFSEDGIPLLYEIPAAPTQGAGGSLNATGTYSYVFVGEWTNNAGERVRGPVGPPVTFAMSAGSTKLTFTGYNIHVSNKQFLMVAVYRTIWDSTNGVQSTTYRKVTGSLVAGTYGGPVIYNNDSSNTFTFVDTMSDAAASLNEPLYTDSGMLDRHPAPAFSTGTKAFNRAFVVGYDNAIWFSGEKTEGDSYWFSPAQRIVLPTHERVTAIRQLDNFLLVLCEGSSVFSVASGPFPDATGAGSVPSPVLLPFTNGCPGGHAEPTSDGIMYAATQGGIWMITRDLRNVYVGAPVEDTTASGIVGSASDDKQRVSFVNANDGTQAVYDQVTGIWSTWTSDAFDVDGIGVCPIVSHKGRFALVTSVPSIIARQSLGSYTDWGQSITTTMITAFISFGSVRGYKRVWGVQLQGERLGDADISAQVRSDYDANTVVETFLFTPPAVTKLVVELPLKNELVESLSYAIQDLFNRGPNQGFAYELFGFYLGVEHGLGRLPAPSRFPPI
jgi:hypothetical protein